MGLKGGEFERWVVRNREIHWLGSVENTETERVKKKEAMIGSIKRYIKLFVC